jgi:hypothetical protein
MYGLRISYPDLNGDGQADVCARGTDGIDCALSDGTSFGTVTTLSTTFSNANGWMTALYGWQTIASPLIAMGTCHPRPIQTPLCRVSQRLDQ